jgi:murein DD-endopeptidase MepM/ murein hydrolase activator NlpD
MKTDKVTFIFIPRKEEEQKILNISYPLFTFLKVFFVVLLATLVLSYIILIPRVVKYRDYCSKIENYNTQEAQLQKLLQDVNKMKQFNTYMRELVGLDMYASPNDYSVIADMQSESDQVSSVTGIPELAPVNGPVTRKFMAGPRQHYGIDISGKVGDPVLASADGLVVFAGWTPELGNMVVISHSDDYITVYGHNDRLNVQERQRVKKGDLIALLGKTGYSMGPHLHFEVWNKGLAVDPQTIIPEYMTKN